jgi:hypothetical protein
MRRAASAREKIRLPDSIRYAAREDLVAVDRVVSSFERCVCLTRRALRGLLFQRGDFEMLWRSFRESTNDAIYMGLAKIQCVGITR